MGKNIRVSVQYLYMHLTQEGFFHSPGVGQAVIITLIELIKSLEALTFCFLWDQTYVLGL